MSRFLLTGLSAAAILAIVACDPAAKVDREAEDVATKQIKAQENASELAVKQNAELADLEMKQREDRAKQGEKAAEGIAAEQRELTNAIVDLKGERAQLHGDLIKRLDTASADLRKVQTAATTDGKTTKADFNAKLEAARQAQTRARTDIHDVARTEESLMKTSSKTASTSVDNFEKTISDLKSSIN